MNDLVIMHDEQAVTTSLKVAESFSKAHRDVMKAIRNLTAQNCAVGNMFDKATYINKALKGKFDDNYQKVIVSTLGI